LGRRIRYDNLTGGLNTVSSLGTINQSPNRTETPDCQNVEYFLLGGIKSMEGNTKIGDTLPARELLLWIRHRGVVLFNKVTY